jgi:hypothetical protein
MGKKSKATPTKNYTQEQLQLALEAAYAQTVSKREAARVHQVQPCSELQVW